MKKWIEEIGKGYLAAIGAALLPLTLAAIPQLPKWALGLTLSEVAVLYIRAGLALLGLALLALVGWRLFFQTRRKLHLVEQQLRDAQSKPHRFRDDCTFDTKHGLYRHKSRTELFCGACTSQDVESPVKEMEHGWQCLINKSHWHPNPDHKRPPPERRRIQMAEYASTSSSLSQPPFDRLLRLMFVRTK